MNLKEDNSGFIRSLFMRSVWSCVAAQVVSTVGPIICVSIAGLVFGHNGLAVIGLYSPFFFLAGFFGTLISTGSAAVAARYVAQDDYKRVCEIYALAQILALGLAAALCFALFMLQEPILTALVGDEALAGLSARYYAPTVWYVFFTIIAHMPIPWSRLMGKPGISLILTLVISGLSVVFGALLVFALDMELESLVTGQAAATAIAFVLAVILLHSAKTGLVFKRPSHIREDVQAIILAGSPPGLSKLYRFASILLINTILLQAGGAQAVAVYSVLNMLLRFVTAFVNGVSGVQMPIAGVLKEERDNTSLRQLAGVVYKYSNVMIIITAVLLVVLRQQVAALFGVEGEAVNFALICFCVYIPFYVNGSLFISWCTAIGQVALANIAAFAQDMLYLPMFAMLLSGFSGNLIWLHLPVSGLAFLLLLPLLLLFAGMRKLSFPLLTEKNTGDVSLAFSVERDIEKASQAAAAVDEFCEQLGLERRQSMLLSLAIEEMVTLVVSQNVQGGNISIRLTHFEGGVVLRLRDTGKKFNPVAYCEERMRSAQGVEETVEFMGMKYITEAAEVVYYRETFGVNNLVVII